MYDFSFTADDSYIPLKRDWDKPKSLEEPIEDNYTEEQVKRLVDSYNKYLKEDSHLLISVKEGKISKKTGKQTKYFLLHNMNCKITSDSTKKNKWVIKGNDEIEILKDTLEQCLRYLVKYRYVFCRPDIEEAMVKKTIMR